MDALTVNLIGDLLAVIAAVIWAGYSTLTKKISTFGCNTIQTTRRTFFYGLIFMLPVLSVMDFQVSLSQFKSPVVLWNLLFLGLFASAVCFVTWNVAVRLLGSVRTSVYIYAVPVITAVTSVLILNSYLDPTPIGKRAPSPAFPSRLPFPAASGLAWAEDCAGWKNLLRNAFH